MMNQSQLSVKLIALFLVLGALSSCDKSDDPKKISCDILSIESNSTEEDGSSYSSETTYIYNSDNQLASMEGSIEEMECNNDECETTKDKTTFAFSYAKDIITVTFEPEDETYKIYMSGDIINKVVDSANYNGKILISETRYFYSGEKLSKIEYWRSYNDPSTEEFTLSGYREITYTGNNISEDKTFYNSRDNDEGARSILAKKNRSFAPNARTKAVISLGETSFTHDSKINPFKGSVLSLLQGSYQFFNENNTLTITYKNENEEIFGYISSSYMYDENDLPVQITVAYDGNNNSDIGTITYQCK